MATFLQVVERPLERDEEPCPLNRCSHLPDICSYRTLYTNRQYGIMSGEPGGHTNRSMSPERFAILAGLAFKTGHIIMLELSHYCWITRNLWLRTNCQEAVHRNSHQSMYLDSPVGTTPSSWAHYTVIKPACTLPCWQLNLWPHRIYTATLPTETLRHRIV